MSTLSEAINAYADTGFTEHFAVRSRRLLGLDGGSSFEAHDDPGAAHHRPRRCRQCVEVRHIGPSRSDRRGNEGWREATPSRSSTSSNIRNITAGASRWAT